MDRRRRSRAIERTAAAASDCATAHDVPITRSVARLPLLARPPRASAGRCLAAKSARHLAQQPRSSARPLIRVEPRGAPVRRPGGSVRVRARLPSRALAGEARDARARQPAAERAREEHGERAVCAAFGTGRNARARHERVAASRSSHEPADRRRELRASPPSCPARPSPPASRFATASRYVRIGSTLPEPRRFARGRAAASRARATGPRASPAADARRSGDAAADLDARPSACAPPTEARAVRDVAHRGSSGRHAAAQPASRRSGPTASSASTSAAPPPRPRPRRYSGLGLRRSRRRRRLVAHRTRRGGARSAAERRLVDHAAGALAGPGRLVLPAWGAARPSARGEGRRGARAGAAAPRIDFDARAARPHAGAAAFRRPPPPRPRRGCQRTSSACTASRRTLRGAVTARGLAQHEPDGVAKSAPHRLVLRHAVARARRRSRPRVTEPRAVERCLRSEDRHPAARTPSPPAAYCRRRLSSNVTQRPRRASARRECMLDGRPLGSCACLMACSCCCSDWHERRRRGEVRITTPSAARSRTRPRSEGAPPARWPPRPQHRRAADIAPRAGAARIAPRVRDARAATRTPPRRYAAARPRDRARASRRGIAASPAANAAALAVPSRARP